jgi:hypothetical protein
MNTSLTDPSVVTERVVHTSLVVFSDVDCEVDDKLALEFISKFNIPTLVVIMPTSHGTSLDGLNEWKRINPKWDTLSYFTYILFEEFVKYARVYTDYVLQISPMFKILNKHYYNGHNLIVYKQYIFAGRYHTKKHEIPSFNYKGSIQILERFADILIEISSTLMATKRPTVELYNILPCLFQENMKWISFKFALGRMNVSDPCIGVYGEGLINPTLGRGSNYIAIENLYTSICIDAIKQNIIPSYTNIVLDKEKYAKIYSITFQYLSYIKPTHYLSETYLFRMNIALSIIFPNIWKQRDAVIYSDEISIENRLVKTLWDTFTQYDIKRVIPTFTPTYDLFASYILLIIINSNLSHTKFVVTKDHKSLFNVQIIKHFKNASRGIPIINMYTVE